MKIAVIIGSLQQDSYNKKLARTIEGLMPEGVEFDYVDINMPLFNQDLEAQYPAEATAAKNIIAAADGILFVTPEYNRSLPGVMKNAIDWVSRPYGQNTFDGKPAGVIGASISPVGTAFAQSDLRHVAAFLNMKLMGQPEVYVANAGSLPFDGEDGALTDERWLKNLRAYAETFVAWVEASRQ
ncbi:MAG TPA: NAD(P)H-dependent oxidoreductase [Candidatus Saccharimonadales bacterium]|nr:NAD(P)H-dependent oxidoreductase [Candidatus Saccharimonadales bacterium]